ncbi:MAG TPA: efflux RND transporter permease subunit, partial [Chitinophaga sp.]|nr:efflux RND transporter permease subunit [Chitinophaga sp.]
REIALPKLLILLCVIAVFVPALFMSGIPGAMFLPLSLAVGFAMIASFILSQTLVPVFSHWLLKDRKTNTNTRFDQFRTRYKDRLDRIVERSSLVTPIYLILALGLLAGGFLLMGTEIFPKTDAGQAQVRLRLPAGTRVERTETATQELLHLADSIANGQIEISSAFVGVQPSSYPVNLIHLWTSGPHESVIKIKLQKGADIAIERFKEQLRQAVKNKLPTATLSFEPGDMVEQVVNLGTANPIEIAVLGRNLSQSRKVAATLNKKLQDITYLRDVQIATPLEYPGIKLNIDRVKAGQLGLTVDQVSRSAVVATSSSRFTQPNYWLDKNTGTAYQVQVEYPQYRVSNSDELGLVPVSGGTGSPVYLRDVTTSQKTTSPGEYDRINQQRYITLTANVFHKDVGTAIKDVKKAIASLGELPQGVKIMLRGQADLLDQTMNELETGLLIAIVVIFLMLTVNFQSFRLSLVVLSVIPAVIAGALLLLLLTGQTLNIQSYMGTIMAVGVAIANAILLVTDGEQYRKQQLNTGFAVTGAGNRLRPILMTSFAMIAGMVPMAIGLGEGGKQTAPLGIAVIGGLILSTISTLIFLPAIYTGMMGRKAYHSPSLHPEDKDSRYYEANNK